MAGAIDRVSHNNSQDHQLNRALEKELLFAQRVDKELFHEQYRAFVALLRAHLPTVTVDEVFCSLVPEGTNNPDYTQARQNPNFIYTRDAIITLPWREDAYICGAMKDKIRREESRTSETALRKLGLKPLIAEPVPDGEYLEGGDVIPFSYDGKRVFLIGYGRRTTMGAIDWLAEQLIPQHIDEIIAVRLAPWRINLDGANVPISEDVLVTHRESIGWHPSPERFYQAMQDGLLACTELSAARRSQLQGSTGNLKERSALLEEVLAETDWHAIPWEVMLKSGRGSVGVATRIYEGKRELIDYYEFMLDTLGYRIVDAELEKSWFQQTCNIFNLGQQDNGRYRCVAYDLTPEVAEQIRAFGIELLTFPGGELVKGRGGPRCMTRHLYGAEVALAVQRLRRGG